MELRNVMNQKIPVNNETITLPTLEGFCLQPKSAATLESASCFFGTDKGTGH